MKAHSISSGYLLWAGLLLVLIAATWFGCSSTPGSRIDWNSRIGNYTYNQAVQELGPPDTSKKLADQSIVAEWLIKRTSTNDYVSTETSFGPTAARYWFGATDQRHTIYPALNDFLRLTFDSQGRLLAWKKLSR
jgi:hypothetical protein